MNANQKRYLIVSGAILGVVILAAVLTRLWVLTAIPIGFLFGFFLQKGDLCGASAFSEVLLMKDWRKIWGLWVCIVTGMVGFAVLDLLGWVTLNPKPMLWANYIVGGILFGVGMVLAGGCVSGCLFKSGTGNLNSMMGLLGIAIGATAVDFGPLHPIHTWLESHVVKLPNGGAVSLSGLTGLPFWVLALCFAAVTLLAAFLLKRRSNAPRPAGKEPFSLTHKLLARTWKPWQAGLLIGLLGSAAYFSSVATGRNYPLGVIHGVLHLHVLLTDSHLTYVYKRPPAPAKPVNPPTAAEPAQASGQSAKTAVAPAQPGKKVSLWLILLVTSLVTGSWVSGRLSGQARLLPKPPEQIVIAFIGGLLTGVGAALATGCVIGNILSGWALMSVGMVLFGIVTVLVNWATTYVYLMGGWRG
jgi:hypothetical protein